MHRIFLTVVLTVLLLSTNLAALPVRAEEKQQKLKWHGALETALAEAEKASKPVFVYVKDSD